jgi:hypothetical protein
MEILLMQMWRKGDRPDEGQSVDAHVDVNVDVDIDDSVGTDQDDAGRGEK